MSESSEENFWGRLNTDLKHVGLNFERMGGGGRVGIFFFKGTRIHKKRAYRYLEILPTMFQGENPSGGYENMHAQEKL